MFPGYTHHLQGTRIALLVQGLAPWALWLCVFSQTAFICIFLWEKRKLHTFSMSTSTEDLPGHWKVMLCRTSQDEGMLGTIGVDLRSRGMSSRVFPESWAVMSMVFRVIPWCSMNPLDLGKLGVRLCGLYGAARTELAPWMWSMGHCQWKTDKAVCTGRWALASNHIETGLIWWIPYTRRDTYWTSCTLTSTLYPNGWGSQQQFPGMGHWGCL